MKGLQAMESGEKGSENFHPNEAGRTDDMATARVAGRTVGYNTGRDMTGWVR